MRTMLRFRPCDAITHLACKTQTNRMVNGKQPFEQRGTTKTRCTYDSRHVASDSWLPGRCLKNLDDTTRIKLTVSWGAHNVETHGTCSSPPFPQASMLPREERRLESPEIWKATNNFA